MLHLSCVKVGIDYFQEEKENTRKGKCMSFKKNLLTALVSCGLIAGSMSSHSALAVTNGYEALPDTVAGSTAKLGIEGMNCSATMISPSWAITAKHCIDILGIIEVPVIFPLQTGINVKDSSSEKYIAKVYQNPDTDLALLNINGVHKGTIAELPTRSTERRAQLKIVGFGNNGKDVDVAQYAKVDVTKKREFKEVYTNEIGVTTSYTGKWILANNNEKGEVKSGDSGGGAFLGNEIHGVFSSGIVGEKSDFRKELTFVEVFHYLNWIHEVTGIVSVPQNASEQGKSGDFQRNYQNPIVTDNGAYDSVFSSNSSNFVFGSSS